jgi:pyruvate ferredoxin oxidoreductase beta subunit
VVFANATGCTEVTTTIYPYTSWNVPYIHSAFGNVASTISGVEAAFKALQGRGKIKKLNNGREIKKVKFIALAGDGGSYDIGLQALSGPLDRRHNFVFVCYDNEGYMNTGNQRSSATPLGARTTTTPVGEKIMGKQLFRKNLTKIVVAHDISYAAAVSVSHRLDFHNKIKKALAVEGPAFINVLAPCTLGWKFPEDMGITIARLGVETNFWPLYEVEGGKYRLSFKPKKRKPIEEFLKPQGRFKHLFKKENLHIVDRLQEHVDGEWAKLLDLCKR